MTQFGCKNCWPSEAPAACIAVMNTGIQRHLLNEAHFIASIRAYKTCF